MLCVAQRFVTFLDIPAPILKVPQFRLLFSNPDSAGMAVCSYFYEAMPEGTSVERLERWESQVQDGV